MCKKNKKNIYTEEEMLEMFIANYAIEGIHIDRKAVKDVFKTAKKINNKTNK
jgi:hypothetical protein